MWGHEKGTNTFHVMFRKEEIISDWRFLGRSFGFLLKNIFWRKENSHVVLEMANVSIYRDSEGDSW